MRKISCNACVNLEFLECAILYNNVQQKSYKMAGHDPSIFIFTILIGKFTIMRSSSVGLLVCWNFNFFELVLSSINSHWTP